MLHTLGYELGLRIWSFPEAVHASWNDTKNSIRRANKQYTVLLGTILANASHGPFASGKTRQTLVEAAESLARTVDAATFRVLVERMAADRGVEVGDVSLPQRPSDLPQLGAIRNLPPYAPRLLQSPIQTVSGTGDYGPQSPSARATVCCYLFSYYRVFFRMSRNL